MALGAAAAEGGEDADASKVGRFRSKAEEVERAHACMYLHSYTHPHKDTTQLPLPPTHSHTRKRSHTPTPAGPARGPERGHGGAAGPGDGLPHTDTHIHTPTHINTGAHTHTTHKQPHPYNSQNTQAPTQTPTSLQVILPEDLTGSDKADLASQVRCVPRICFFLS